ncbi:MAG: metal-dependent hydrolase [Candidatus Limnocylindria bacterium]
MANLRITWIGHGGILYRSPQEKWIWVDRWTGAPTYPDAYRALEQVHVVAPTHGHFDHAGDDLSDVIELANVDGAAVVCSHEMSVYLAGKGIEAVGMNKGGTFEAAGIRFTMLHADHTGGATLTDGDVEVTRDFGCWGWVIEFEDGTTVYHSGDTDLFGDMRLVGERFSPEIAILPIGGHYTMGPEDAGRALALIGAPTVVPVHWGTFPALAGTPERLADHTDARVVELAPGDTWEAER